MMSEENFTVGALGDLRDFMRSRGFSFDQLSQAAGWNPDTLEPRLWDDHGTLSIEVFRELLTDIGGLSIPTVSPGRGESATPAKEGQEQEGPLDEFSDHLFETASYRRTKKAGPGDQDEQPKTVSPFRQLFNIFAFKLFKDTLEGHYPTNRLEATLRQFAEEVKELEDSAGSPGFRPAAQ